jgi:glyoxylase-like metal-dependent hydrolase (beta-lactamase superfamily II)
MEKNIKMVLVAVGAVLAVIVIVFLQVAMAFSSVEIVYKPNTVENSVVQPVTFGHSNIYFIETQTGYILVDAGVPGNEEKLDELFEITEVDPKSVQLIIATHGHMDHIGMLAYAKEVTGAKLLAHKSLEQNILNGGFESATAQTLFGQFLNFMASLAPIEIQATTADILIEDTYYLDEYGIAGKIIPTPGHSQSSLSIILDNGEALTGDLVRPDDSGNIYLGMFYEDKETLILSLEKVAGHEPRTIYLSHGEYIDNEVLKEVIETEK